MIHIILAVSLCFLNIDAHCLIHRVLNGFDYHYLPSIRTNLVPSKPKLDPIVFGNICTDSDTTVVENEEPAKAYCNEDLVFEDDFDTLDLKKWKHENTLRGGGNWEFQYYTPDSRNSFVKDGYLSIRPTLTSDDYEDKNFVLFGEISLGENCTDGRDYGCQRTGSFTNVLNPIKSASIHTKQSFSFKYGKLEVRAKMPRGDWLWPSITMLPKANVYGEWPASGQIVVAESRGNRNLTQNGENIGVELVRSAIVVGPNAQSTLINAVFNTRGNKFHREFHRYQMEWTPEHIVFKINNKLVEQVNVKDGFYQLGDYGAQNIPNPWSNGTLFAPFDQEFYIQIQLAVGGISKHFPDVDDEFENPGGKPWLNNSTQAATDFWTYRNSWIDEWDLRPNATASNMMIDYVKVWSLR